MEEIHYISANAEMKNVTENKSLKAENPDFCNSEIHDPKDQENIKENKENKEMTTITVNVTGMMCGHCEAHVTKAVIPCISLRISSDIFLYNGHVFYVVSGSGFP